MKNVLVCDVIMLAWNKRETTERCVESYLRHTKLPTRLILIDNASTDDTPQYFTSLKNTSSCEIQVITNEQNNGFVGGMNQGIAASTAPYVCLANNDLVFTDGWLEEMLAVFEKYPQVGLLNPNSNNLGAKVPEGRSIDAFAAELRSTKAGGFAEMPDCVGFCMMIPKEVVQKVGGLSEEFQPMFFEDTDYSRKVAKAGYLLGLEKGAYVWHEEHASMKQLSDQGEQAFRRSRAIFEKKWGLAQRILYVAPSAEPSREDLLECISLARHGHQVTLAARQLPFDPQSLFIKNGVAEHYGINFFVFSHPIQLIFRIFTKKKKYQKILVSKSKVFLFSKLKKLAIFGGYPEVDTPKNLIREN